MGNLSSQYISQSFQSLLHLGSDTTASATLTEITAVNPSRKSSQLISNFNLAKNPCFSA